jgi:hypothetical protein
MAYTDERGVIHYESLISARKKAYDSLKLLREVIKEMETKKVN